MALSGLENKLRAKTKYRQYKEKINVITYADDFVVTAASETILKEKVIPILKTALSKVGLELSQEKTKITRIEDGFDFLGFNIRKYSCGKLLPKPAKANVIKFLAEIRETIKKGIALPAEKLIYQLNSKLVGWTNHYRSSVASKVFALIDNEIFLALKRWGYKRHARKGKRWIMRKYFTRVNNDNWCFHCIVKDKDGKTKPIYLKRATDTHIRRHKKIMGEANPFNPRYKDFKQREKERIIRSCMDKTVKSAGLRIIQPYEGLSAVR